MTHPRVLSLLTGLASLAFAAAAVAGWVLGLLPQTPLTLAGATALVAAGPLLAVVLSVSARDDELEDDVEFETVVAPAPEPVRPPLPPLSRRHAEARAFHAWRDHAPVR